MRLTRALPLLVPFLVSPAAGARAGLIFDMGAPGLTAEVEYGIEGTAYEDFPMDPDVGTIDFQWTSIAKGGDPFAFDGSDGVSVFFGFLLPIESDTFLLDFVFLAGVPTSNPSFPRIDLYTDNLSGNSHAGGRVLVDTPELLVMEIDAGIHWNIPVYPDFSWGGTFLITMTRTPEPSAVILLGFGFVGCFALRRRRRASGPSPAARAGDSSTGT